MDSMTDIAADIVRHLIAAGAETGTRTGFQGAIAVTASNPATDKHSAYTLCPDLFVCRAGDDPAMDIADEMLHRIGLAMPEPYTDRFRAAFIAMRGGADKGDESGDSAARLVVAVREAHAAMIEKLAASIPPEHRDGARRLLAHRASRDVLQRVAAAMPIEEG